MKPMNQTADARQVLKRTRKVTAVLFIVMTAAFFLLFGVFGSASTPRETGSETFMPGPALEHSR